jgi:hypothetical protein
LALGASLLLALASAGIFAARGGAWTSELRFAGATVRVNVPAVLRLATLPGVVHVLDGRAIGSRAGSLRLQRDGRALRVRCAPCRLQHADLSPAPVQVPSVELLVARHDDAIDGTLTIDHVMLTYTGRVTRDHIDIAWRLPPTEFAQLVRALGDALPESQFARLEGRVSAHGTLILPARALTIAGWSAEQLEVGGLGTEALQYGWFRFSCGGRDGARLTITGDGESPWLAADAMGPYLAAAVLAAEDQRFHQHAGYDAEAISEIVADLRNGRPTRGASTITQQLARTLFTGGERTAVRKLRELLYALEMERTLGKARILELYLNTVDWGPGLCGAKAAARAYFNRPPARLTALEAAWLAGVLRNPHAAWEQQFAARQPDRARATVVLMQMRDWPKRERRRFAQQPLAFASTARPPVRPHAPVLATTAPARSAAAHSASR